MQQPWDQRATEGSLNSSLRAGASDAEHFLMKGNQIIRSATDLRLFDWEIDILLSCSQRDFIFKASSL